MFLGVIWLVDADAGLSNHWLAEGGANDVDGADDVDSLGLGEDVASVDRPTNGLFCRGKPAIGKEYGVFMFLSDSALSTSDASS